MSERNKLLQYTHVRVDDGRTPTFDERAQTHRHRVRADEGQMHSRLEKSRTTPEKPHKIWRRMAAAGTLAVAGFVGVKAAEAQKTPKPVKIVQEIARPGDGAWSMVDRANDDSVDIRPLVDDVLNNPNVKDGLLPGEVVDVPIVKPTRNNN